MQQRENLASFLAELSHGLVGGSMWRGLMASQSHMITMKPLQILIEGFRHQCL